MNSGNNDSASKYHQDVLRKWQDFRIVFLRDLQSEARRRAPRAVRPSARAARHTEVPPVYMNETGRSVARRVAVRTRALREIPIVQALTRPRGLESTAQKGCTCSIASHTTRCITVHHVSRI